MKNNIQKSWFILISLIILIIILVFSVQNNLSKNEKLGINFGKKETFRIISSSENENIENVLTDFAKENNIDLEIEYAGTIDIMDRLNNGEKYDAVWTSNSIWLYMLDSNVVSVTNSKSISINPVIFGIKKSKAEQLGFTNKEVTTKDIVDAIQNGNLKFNMSSATQTNTGATAYLGFVSTLAGNPEVLRKEDLEKEELQTKIATLLSGVSRSSGSDEFLEEMFMTGDYDAVVTYEASIINMNKKLISSGKEPLYAIYPIDGVSISDSPFAFIKGGEKEKLEIFEKLQTYLLSNEGQAKLGQTGRRVWYGGINENADKTIFNPEWGIDTSKYIVPVKYPSVSVIKEALSIYQAELRKPTHTIFCLDYSGSMYGNGITSLKKAMDYILIQESASQNLVQFSKKDKITIIPFNNQVLDIWTTDDGTKTQELLNNINQKQPNGGTAIYEATSKAVELLSKENQDEYNLSVVLMTDGENNNGSFKQLESVYHNINRDIPIFSILFGQASEKQLKEIANLTNAKIFDGRSNLMEAFKEVRGYN